MSIKSAFKIYPTNKVEIIEKFTGYQVKWICDKGHVNFHTILGTETSDHDICLSCGKHYELIINKKNEK